MLHSVELGVEVDEDGQLGDLVFQAFDGGGGGGAADVIGGGEELLAGLLDLLRRFLRGAAQVGDGVVAARRGIEAPADGGVAFDRVQELLALLGMRLRISEGGA